MKEKRKKKEQKELGMNEKSTKWTGNEKAKKNRH